MTAKSALAPFVGQQDAITEYVRSQIDGEAEGYDEWYGLYDAQGKCDVRQKETIFSGQIHLPLEIFILEFGRPYS